MKEKEKMKVFYVILYQLYPRLQGKGTPWSVNNLSA